MPDKQFTIPPINPLGLFLLDDPYELNLNNSPCYKQKYSEDVTIQILSDYEPIAELFSADTGQLISAQPEIEVKATNIQGQTFSVYEITYPFGSLVGEYIGTLGYTTDLDELVTYQTLIVDCKATHPNTLLFQYLNTENNFSIAFSTGIVLKLRVEGVVRSPQFESNDTIYNDLNEDSVLLDSTPFRTFKLICGVSPTLIPDWIGDKINRALSCNSVAINGLYYSKVEGEKLEIKRPDPLATKDKPNLSLSTTIQPVENISLQKLILGENLPQGYVPMSHYKNYFNVGADFSITGLFNAFSMVTHIVVKNRGSEISAFRVGTTAGAEDVVNETEIPAAVGNFTTYPISVDDFVIGNIYLSGLSGANCDVFVHWLQFDEKEIVPGRETTLVKMPARSIVNVGGTREQLEALFDFGTGLGRAGTDYETARICNGLNGTDDWGLRTPLSYKEGAKWSDLGIVVAGNPEIPIGSKFGAAQSTLEVRNLPPIKANITGAAGATGGGGVSFNRGPNTDVSLPISGTNGQSPNSEPINTLSPVIYTLTVQFF